VYPRRKQSHLLTRFLFSLDPFRTIDNSTLLNILYKDEETPTDAMSFTEVLEKMRDDLQAKGFEQIPQLSASHEIDVSVNFDLVPTEATGTHRAVMIGINYVGAEQGELSGCHNDALNMKNYIMKVHGFDEENIVVLLDDGEHESPTKENILAAIAKVASETQPGDALFLHYSGHGTKVADTSGDEADKNDEAIVPVDYNDVGLIMDDDLYEALVKPLPKGAFAVCLFDCCHSGTVLDLPYVFKADGQFTQMEVQESFNLDKFLGKVGAPDSIKQQILSQVQGHKQQILSQVESAIPDSVPDGLKKGLMGALSKW
jgi:metacaspase-1